MSRRLCNLDSLQLLRGEANIVGRIAIRLEGGETGDGGVWNVAFDAILGTDFYIVGNAPDDLDTLAAFQLGIYIEAVQGIVDPHLVVI